MRFATAPECQLPRPQVRAKLLTALEAMRVADALLSQAIDDYTPARTRSEAGIQHIDLIEAYASVHVFAAMLQELVGGVNPSVSDGVFHAIRAHRNYYAENTPHAEAVILAMMLAADSLQEALSLDTELNGEGDIDDTYEVMVAASSSISLVADVLEGRAVSFFPKEILEAMLEGKPGPDMEELRMKHLAARRQYPKAFPVPAAYASV